MLGKIQRKRIERKDQEADFVILMAREEVKKESLNIQPNSYYTERTKVSLAKNRVGGSTPTWWMSMEEGKLKTIFVDYEEEQVRKKLWKKKELFTA